RSTTSTTIERRRLLDRMPIGLIGRDHASEDILVRIVAAAVFLGGTLLDPDLGDEVLAVEPFETDSTSRTRFRALVLRLEAERAIKYGFEYAEIAGRHLLLSIGRASEQQVVPELATLVGSIENGELEVEHFAVTVGAALAHAILTDPAGADVG